MKLQAWSSEPVIVEFPGRRAKTANGELDVAHEVRVMRLYPPCPGFGPLPYDIGCDCPRVAHVGQYIRVWHSPECPAIDKDI